MTLSMDLATRKQGESRIENDQRSNGFIVALLLFIKEANQPKQNGVRVAAAILFKNICKARWDLEEGDSQALAPTDKDTVKTHVVDLMCASPPNVRRILSEALSSISKVDFPDKWPSLLPSLVSKLAGDDFDLINGVLDTANSIFKRFRDVEDSDAVRYPLKNALLGFQEPLLFLWKRLSAMVIEHHNVEAALLTLLPALRTMAAIFYSLTWLELPEYFEDHLKEWMEEFHYYLTYENALVKGDDDELSEAGPVQLLQTAIIRNINLLAEKYDEEFNPFFNVCVQDVWSLLTKSKNITKYDGMVCISLKFLSSVVAQRMHAELFSSESSLSSLLNGIAIPNLHIRENDIDIFESNPTEYLRRDLDGDIDSDSRLAGALSLIKKMRFNFEAQVTSLGSNNIASLLNEYKEGKGWEKKDCAIKLHQALCVTKFTKKGGVTEVNAFPFLDPLTFFTNTIANELVDKNINANPVLKAAAIKYVCIFRNQLPPDFYPTLFDSLLSFLGSNNEVVYTYAAVCIDKLLTCKVHGGVSNSVLTPRLSALFTGLFNVMEKGKRENEYIMEAILRIINVSKGEVLPFIESLLGKLTTLLGIVCKNPSNPSFNHHLFNAIAALVKNICSTTPSATDSFESLLFPPFQSILQADIVEFSPYVFQILSQLLEYRPSGMSVAYSSMFPFLLAPVLWGRESNVEPLVRLLQAYFTKDPTIIGTNITGVLGVFQKLISSRKTQSSGFQLLESICVYIPLEIWSPFFGEILKMLLGKMAKSKNAQFSRLLVCFLALYCHKVGGANLIQISEGIQVGLFTMVLEQIWLANISKLIDNSEKKKCCLGLINLLCTSQIYATKFFPPITAALLTILELPQEISKEEEEEEEKEGGFGEGEVYAGEYSKLSFAASKNKDFFPEIKDIKQHLSLSLQNASQVNQGVLLNLLGSLPVNEQGVLQSYFSKYGAKIV